MKTAYSKEFLPQFDSDNRLIVIIIITTIIIFPSSCLSQGLKQGFDLFAEIMIAKRSTMNQGFTRGGQYRALGGRRSTRNLESLKGRANNTAISNRNEIDEDLFRSPLRYLLTRFISVLPRYPANKILERITSGTE